MRSSASLVAQRLKRLPAMQETWVWSLGREDPLEKEMATHSSILAWRIPWTEELGELHTVHGVAESQTQLSDFTFTLDMYTFHLNRYFPWFISFVLIGVISSWGPSIVLSLEFRSSSSIPSMSALSPVSYLPLSFMLWKNFSTLCFLSQMYSFSRAQAPRSMGFSRQEYWSGVPLPSPNSTVMYI